MNTSRILKTFLVIGLVAVGGIFFLFYRFYQHDIKALENFTAAYRVFDQSMSDFSGAVFASNPENMPPTNYLEQKADAELADLTTKSSARISSMIKNEGDVMRTNTEIAALAGKELDALKAYQIAAAEKSPNLEGLANQLHELTAQRQAAYTHLLSLGGE